jgi:uncharacterized membrane protein
MDRQEQSSCGICGRLTSSQEAGRFSAFREPIARALAARAGHALDADAVVCRPCASAAQQAYLSARLEAERGELSALEQDITRKAAEHAAVAVHIDELFAQKTSRGQRVADTVARVGGSWAFVLSFMGVLLMWMAINTWALGRSAFDPYPYILLNLVLSCVAALQAPIIMMSQNRTSKRDRMQADQDFRVNLKAELEVASLHDKLDHLLHTRWENLLEVQEEQIDLLRSLVDAAAPRDPTAPG